MFAGSSIPTTNKNLSISSYSGSGYTTSGYIYSGYTFNGGSDYKFTLTDKSTWNSNFYVTVYSLNRGKLGEIYVPGRNSVTISTHGPTDVIYLQFRDTAGTYSFSYTLSRID